MWMNDRHYDTGKQEDARRDLFGNRIVWHQLPNGESYSIRISLTKNLGISTVSPVTEHGITINISESSEPSERCRLVNQSVEKGHLGTKNQLEHWNSCWIFSEFLHFSWRFFLQGETQTGMLWQHQKPAETNNFVRYIPMFASPFWRCVLHPPQVDRKWPTLGEWGDVFCRVTKLGFAIRRYIAGSDVDLIYSVALYLLKTIEAVNISPWTPWSAVLFSKRRPFWDSCYHHSSDVAVTSQWRRSWFIPNYGWLNHHHSPSFTINQSPLTTINHH